MIYGYDKNTGAEILKIEEHWGVEYRKTNNKLHREDGPAIEESNGTKAWYINGKLHREDGPALEHAYGCKSWYKYDRLHRVDGPAIVKADGTEEWYWLGEKLTQKEHSKYEKEDAEYKKINRELEIAKNKDNVSSAITAIREDSNSNQLVGYSFKMSK